MRSAAPLAFCLLFSSPSVLAAGGPGKGAARAQKAHAHGSVELGIAVDGAVAEIDLEGPAESFFGFEHAPRTDAQKKAVSDALAILRDKPETLFAFAAGAACKATATAVTAAQEAAVKGGKAAAHGHDHHAKDGDEHAEVSGRWTFTCKAPLSGSKLELNLIKTFPRMQRVALALVSGGKQGGKTLTKDEALEL